MPAKTNAQSKKRQKKKKEQKETKKKHTTKRNVRDDRIDRPARFDMLDIFLYGFVHFDTA